MKHLSALIKLTLVLVFIFGCKKKVEEEILPVTDPVTTGPVVDTVIIVSNKTATDFTVTWNAATDDSTATADLEYKLVYSTSNNLTTTADAEANGTVAVDWTANILTGNLTTLTHSTTYYFAVLVKDEDDTMALEGDSATTLCTGKKMFLATVADGSFGGKAGGDAACMAQRPGGVGNYKAVLSDSTGINTVTGFPSGTGRQACFGNCESANLYVEDWPLLSTQVYCSADFVTKIGSTSARPVLYVSVANVLSSTPIKLFTGFNIAWGNAYGSNCSNWTNNAAGSFVGGTTEGLYTGQSGNRDLIAVFPFPDCAGAGAVICAEL